MTTLPIETRTAAWKPPTLTKSLARTVAKRLDKHWAQTGVKSLQDIRDALGSGVAAGMSMADRIEHQAAIKKWTASLSKDDLHKVFRMVEEAKNGKGREQYRMTDDALNRLRAASGLLPSERFASEREAEKFEAEAQAAQAQAEADRQKADASRLKEAAQASGLYGYTKGTQRDVEASVRKAQRRAASVAKTLYAKDERSVDFLKAHAKRANSKTARLILSAMSNIGPRVASDKTAAMLPSERHASSKKAEAQAPQEKVAGGLYGHPTKTARLALVACSDLRAYVGEVAYSLHSRRTAKYGKMTGFLKEHGKTAKCAYSRMILSCYPDAPVSKQAGVKDWRDVRLPRSRKDLWGFYWGLHESLERGSHDFTEPLSDVSDADLRKEVQRLVEQVGSHDTFGVEYVEKMKKQAPRAYKELDGIMGGKLASGEMLKKAFVPDSVDGWLEWADGTRTAAHKEA